MPVDPSSGIIAMGYSNYTQYINKNRNNSLAGRSCMSFNWQFEEAPLTGCLKCDTLCCVIHVNWTKLYLLASQSFILMTDVIFKKTYCAPRRFLWGTFMIVTKTCCKPSKVFQYNIYIYLPDFLWGKIRVRATEIEGANTNANCSLCVRLSWQGLI